MQKELFISMSFEELRSLIADVVKKSLSENSEFSLNYPSDSEVLGTEQVANMLQVSKSYLYKLIMGRELPFYKKGKKIFFLKSEIIEWIKTGRIKTRHEIEIEASTYIATRKFRRK